MTTYGVPKAASTTSSSSGGDRAYIVLARATTNASADPNEPGPSHRGDRSALREVKRAVAQRGFRSIFEPVTPHNKRRNHYADAGAGTSSSAPCPGAPYTGSNRATAASTDPNKEPAASHRSEDHGTLSVADALRRAAKGKMVATESGSDAVSPRSPENMPTVTVVIKDGTQLREPLPPRVSSAGGGADPPYWASTPFKERLVTEEMRHQLAALGSTAPRLVYKRALQTSDVDVALRRLPIFWKQAGACPITEVLTAGEMARVSDMLAGGLKVPSFDRRGRRYDLKFQDPRCSGAFRFAGAEWGRFLRSSSLQSLVEKCKPKFDIHMWVFRSPALRPDVNADHPDGHLGIMLLTKYNFP